MFRYYLKTTFRNLLKNRSHFFINITGLTVGFSAFLLIFLVCEYESHFDNFHAKKDQIYRLVRRSKNNDAYGTGMPFPYSIGVRNEFPQLEKSASIYGMNDIPVIIPGPSGETLKKFRERKGVFFAEPEFFEMFNFKILTGNAQSIKEPFTALLTKDFATRYFGDWKTAPGKTIRAFDKYIKVTGILDTPPVNTDFPLGFVISFSTLPSVDVSLENWVNISDNDCFVQLKPGASPAQFTSLLPAFVTKHVPPAYADYVILLQPLKDIHSDARFGNFNGRVFSKDFTMALRMIGLFLLIIACVNYINLSTANAINRSREVGVRKVLGSNRQQLLLQFFGETGFTCFIALMVAIFLSYLTLPFLNNLLDVQISLSILRSSSVILFILAVWFTVTLLSGFYPALILSGFNPINALKSRIATGNGISLRRGLVIFQFVIAQVLIIGTLLVISQMNYSRNADMGFYKEAVINAAFPDDSVSKSKLDYLRNQLLHQPGIKDVSYSMYGPTGDHFWATDLKLGTNHTDKLDLIVNMKPADTGYFNLYKFKLLAGKVYPSADTVGEFVVNETLVKKLHIAKPEDAIGLLINVAGRTRPIIGVVNDFHIRSFRETIDPVVMMTDKRGYRTANISIDLSKRKESLAAIEANWNKLFPDFVFEYKFVDQIVADYYKQEDQLAKLFKIFAGIAIFISCLGLYGLVSFIASRRKKEIGIRKVLGATIGNIILLLSKEFTILITIAFFIASPLAWYLMRQWLQSYPYRIEIGISFFLITLLSSIFIAWLTVGHSAIKAAIANPVKSLKTE